MLCYGTNRIFIIDFFVVNTTAGPWIFIKPLVETSEVPVVCFQVLRSNFVSSRDQAVQNECAERFVTFNG